MVRGARLEDERSASLTTAWESHRTPLLRLAVLLTGSQEAAEDLVQEAFVRAAAHLRSLAPDAVRPYLRTTVLNLWRKRVRRLSLERRVRLDPAPPSEVAFEERDALWA